PIVSAEFSMQNVVITSGAQITQPGVGFDGTNFMSLWHQAGFLRGNRISASGTAVDPIALNLGPSTHASEGISVTYAAGQYLAAWHYTAKYTQGIYALRVSPSATLLDAAPFPIATFSGPRYGAPSRTPRSASDGTRFLVVWDDHDGYTGAAYGVFG